VRHAYLHVQAAPDKLLDLNKSLYALAYELFEDRWSFLISLTEVK